MTLNVTNFSTNLSACELDLLPFELSGLNVQAVKSKDDVSDAFTVSQNHPFSTNEQLWDSLAEMAYFAGIAYGVDQDGIDIIVLPALLGLRGWTVLTPEDLGLDVDGFLRDATYENGFFNFTFLDQNILDFIYGGQQRVFVAQNDVTGEVRVSFAGTNPLNIEDLQRDIFLAIGDGYSAFSGLETLSDAVVAYWQASQDSGVFGPSVNLSATGHSLGGALAEQFLANVGDGRSNIFGLGIGSPGVRLGSSSGADNFIHIGNTQDWVSSRNDQLHNGVSSLFYEPPYFFDGLPDILTAHNNWRYFERLSMIAESEILSALSPELFDRAIALDPLGYNEFVYDSNDYESNDLFIILGGRDRDIISVLSNDVSLRIETSDGDDRITGGNRGDVLSGGADWDVILGKGGNDILYGGSGSDILIGGEGFDVVFGGLGNDDIIVQSDDQGDIIHDSGGYDNVYVDSMGQFGQAVSLAFTLQDNDLRVASLDVDNAELGYFFIKDAVLSIDTIEDIILVESNSDFDYIDLITADEITHYNVSDIVNQLLGITPIRPNQAPIFGSDLVFDVDENTTDIDALYVIDESDVILVISGGEDYELFYISEDGRLSFRNAPDFENPLDEGGDNLYEVEISAIDEGNLFTRAIALISVQDVFEAQLVFVDPQDPNNGSDGGNDAGTDEGGAVALPFLSVADAVVGEGGVLVFRVDLSRILEVGETVTLTYSLDGAAAAAGFTRPYSGSSGTLVFQAGQMAREIRIPTGQDSDTDDAVVTLNLLQISGARASTDPSTGLSQDGATGIIRDTGGLADLVITQSSIDRGVLNTDGLMVYTVTVENQGSVDASAIVSVRLTDTGPDTVFTLSTDDYGLLGAGERLTLIYRIVASSDHPAAGEADVLILPEGVTGEARLSSFVDVSLSIPESDEDNNLGPNADFVINDATVTLLPDLSVGAFSLSETSASLGGDVNYTLRVDNLGASDVNSSRVGIYLSEDAIIDASDTLLWSPLTGAIAAGQSRTLTGRITIPLSSNDGTYFIGVISDDEGSLIESDENNNSYDAPILFGVGNAPGVRGFGLQFSSLTLEPGGQYSATVTIENSGATPSLAGEARLYLSDDITITPSDDRVDTVVIPQLDVGETVTLTFYFSAPVTLDAGSIYGAVIIDDVPGNSVANRLVTPVALTVPGRPVEGRDLFWKSVETSDVDLVRGDGLVIDYALGNDGNARSEGAGIKIYASTDGTLSADDILLGSSTMGGLEGGAFFERSLAVSSRQLDAGDYYIIAEIATGTQPNVDDDTSNNIQVAAQIRVTEPSENQSSLDGTSLTGWENGQPANDTNLERPVFTTFFGNRWDVDYDADIYSGNRGSTFAREGYKWSNFSPESAVYELDGSGIVFTGTHSGLSAERRMYFNQDFASNLQMRMLDTVTNTTDSSVDFTFSYTFAVGTPGAANSSAFVLIDSNRDGQITTADTQFTLSTSGTAASAPPFSAWALGQDGYFNADQLGFSPGTSYVRMQYTVTIGAGESASFLHFGNQTTNPGETGNSAYVRTATLGSAERAFLGSGLLAGLTSEDLEHVINWDVSQIAAPADLSLEAALFDLGSGRTNISGSVSNLGNLPTSSGAVTLSLIAANGDQVWQTDLASFSDVRQGEPIEFDFTDLLFQRVSGGDYTIVISLSLDEGGNDSQANNEVSLGIISLDDPILFTAGDDIVTLYDNAAVFAGNGDDQVDGTFGDDIITGGNGRDIIRGRDGNDTINDNSTDFASNFFFGGRGDDVITGGRADDTLSGGSGNDWLDGGVGADTLSGGSGQDRVDYSSSADAVIVDLRLGQGFSGTAFGDRLDSIEDITGSAFDDLIIGDALDNYIRGGDGDDILQGGIGNDTLSGGSGRDTAIFSGISPADYTIIQIASGRYTITHNDNGIDGVDTLFSVAYLRMGGVDYVIQVTPIFTSVNDRYLGANWDETLSGLAGDDIILGADGDDRINGNAGDDTLSGNAGVDRLYGNDGADSLNGGLDNDLLFGGEGDDVLNGSAGDDRLFGGLGADIFIGGSGRDRVEYSTAGSGLTANLLQSFRNTGEAEGDTYTTVEDLVGSRFDDVLGGDDGVNSIYGGNGNDRLDGNGGLDRLYGGNGADDLRGGDYGDYLYGGEDGDIIQGNAGNDRLFGENGADNLNGGTEDDQLYGQGGDDILNGSSGNDRLFGGEGADVLIGGSGRDRADYGAAQSAVTASLLDSSINSGEAAGDTYRTIEDLVGSNFNDILIGDNGVNRLYGGLGNDTLFGQGGLDKLYGGLGNDTLLGGDYGDYLYGEAGDDRLDGGAGNDRLYGGNGADVFVFAAGYGIDNIFDYVDGLDQIDLSAFTLSQVQTALGAAVQYGNHLRLDFGNGDLLQIRNTDLSDLAIDDFQL